MPNLLKHYCKLLQEYGEPVKYWPQWCAAKKTISEREKIIIGMVLVQRTNWHNAEIALKNLKKAGVLSIKEIAQMKDLNKLTELIRPAGFYQSKPKRLFDLCTFIVSKGGISRLMKEGGKVLREQLLNIKGIGQETTDTILLYALDEPVFVIDEYTRRWAEKNGLTKEKDYFKLQNYFQKRLKIDLVLYRNLHTLIIVCQRGKEKSVMEIV